METIPAQTPPISQDRHACIITHPDLPGSNAYQDISKAPEHFTFATCTVISLCQFDSPAVYALFWKGALLGASSLACAQLLLFTVPECRSGPHHLVKHPPPTPFWPFKIAEAAGILPCSAYSTLQKMAIRSPPPLVFRRGYNQERYIIRRLINETWRQKRLRRHGT